MRVRWLGDGPESLLSASQIALGIDGGDPERREYEVEKIGPGRPGEVRLALEGVGTREAAEELRGRLVFGRAGDLPALPEGEHYWYELVGCDLETEDGRRVGRIREIWETGAHDVFVVERDDGATCLVPTARELLREIDVEARRVVVEDLPGLFDPADRSGRVDSRGR